MTQRESSAESELKPELRLLLHCAPGGEARAVVRELLSGGIDWTAFAQRVVAHGLTSTAAHRLAQLVPDDLPYDILDAFHTTLRNCDAEALFDPVRMTRGLDAAYTTMWTRVRDQLPWDGFAVDRMSACAT